MSPSRRKLSPSGQPLGISLFLDNKETEKRDGVEARGAARLPARVGEGWDGERAGSAAVLPAVAPTVLHGGTRLPRAGRGRVSAGRRAPLIRRGVVLNGAPHRREAPSRKPGGGVHAEHTPLETPEAAFPASSSHCSKPLLYLLRSSNCWKACP